MNIECSKKHIEEITFDQTQCHLLLQRVNAMVLEMNQQGNLLAIGCKYGIILIFDILSKEVVRYFSVQDTADKSVREMNERVDAFK